MPALAIYLDNDLARRLDRAAKGAGVSRSRFVTDVLRRQLDSKLPDSFFQVLGTWEDGRGTKEILGDIRAGLAPQRRERVR